MIQSKRGQFMLKGFAFLMVLMVLYVGAAALIEPLKEGLDNARDSKELNCPGTIGFNQTAFEEDTNFQRLVRRPTCFATGFTMVYFFGAFMIGAVMWAVSNWRKKK